MSVYINFQQSEERTNVCQSLDSNCNTTLDNNLGKMFQSSGGAGGEYHSHATRDAAEGGREGSTKERRACKEKGCLHLNTFASISWKEE